MISTYISVANDPCNDRILYLEEMLRKQNIIINNMWGNSANFKWDTWEEGEIIYTILKEIDGNKEKT